MTAWTKRLDGLLKKMEEQLNMPKSKGKGKRPRDGVQGAVGQPAKNLSGAQCRCCGRTGHVKSECYHREKTCDNCGKTGHLKAFCTAKVKEDTYLERAMKATSSTSHSTSSSFGDQKDAACCKEPVVPWTCFHCYARCMDHKLNKCEKCHRKRLIAAEKVQDATPKPLISKDILKKIEEGSYPVMADTLGAASGDVNAAKEIQLLEDLIANAKTLGCIGMLEEAEKKMATLKLKANPNTIMLTNTKDVKEVMAEKMRLIQLRGNRRKTLEERAEKATAAKKRHAEEKLKATEVEEKRHKVTMEKLEEEFAKADAHEEKEIKEAAEELTKVHDEYEEQLWILDGHLGPRVQTIKQEKLEVAVITPDVVNTAILQEHFLTDPTLAGILGVQSEAVARSLLIVMNKMAVPLSQANVAAAAASAAAGSASTTSATTTTTTHTGAEGAKASTARAAAQTAEQKSEGPPIGPTEMDVDDGKANGRPTTNPRRGEEPPPKVAALSAA